MVQVETANTTLPQSPRRTPGDKRRQLRDSLWPNYDLWVWKRHTNKGYTTIPRLIPLVMHLISELSTKGNPAAVYLELWSRSYDEGIISITDESSCAYAAGYTGNRAVRTWREHILQLKELGFIDYKAQGIRDIAHILILNPIYVCAYIKANYPDRIKEEWWTAFVHRAQEIGAEIPTFQPATPNPA